MPEIAATKVTLTVFAPEGFEAGISVSSGDDGTVVTVFQGGTMKQTTESAAKESRWLTERELVEKSLEILRLLDGLSVQQARRVIKETESRLDDVTRLDCGSTRFRQVVEELPLFSDESI